MRKQEFNPESLPAPAGYSQIVQVAAGTTLYISGQVSLDENGDLVGEGDFRAQTRQVFNNLVRALHATGATPSDLVRIGIYVVDHDAAKLAVVRAVRDQILGVDHPPASTLLGVAALALPELMIEVDALATVEGDQSVSD